MIKSKALLLPLLQSTREHIPPFAVAATNGQPTGTGPGMTIFWNLLEKGAGATQVHTPMNFSAKEQHRRNSSEQPTPRQEKPPAPPSAQNTYSTEWSTATAMGTSR